MTFFCVAAEVARLFAPYNGGARRNMVKRPAQVKVIRRSDTHTFCCLADHETEKVPSVLLKADLLSSGLGEQKVTFSGQYETRNLPKLKKSLYCGSLQLFAVLLGVYFYSHKYFHMFIFDSNLTDSHSVSNSYHRLTCLVLVCFSCESV